MPIAEFEMPDGRIAEFEIPEGMSPEEATRQVQSMLQQQSAPQGTGWEPAPKQVAIMGTMDSLQQGAENVMGKEALNVLGEFAAAANRSIPELIDHIGVGGVNAFLRKTGVDYQIPTIMSKLEGAGFEGNFMEPGTARDITRAAGATTTAGAGLVSVPRNAAKAGNAVLDLLGVGSSMATAPVKGTALVLRDAKNNLPAILPGERSARQAAELPLKRQSGDIQAAGYQLNAAGKVIPDKAQEDVLRQGLQPKLVAMAKASTALGRKKMGQMLDNVDAQRTNMLNDNVRPSNIAGDSILARAKVIHTANRAAGQRMKPVVESLKGKYIDTNPAVQKLLGSLQDMGISIDPKTKSMVFDGSTIDELPGPTAALKRLFSKMIKVSEAQGLTPAGKVNAYEAHNLKRYIDEVVSYGKSAEGLTGQTENLLKTLRRDLNQVLRDASPEYARVNTQYSETIDALDELQDLAGKRFDISGPNADRALGVLSRRIFSNAASGVPIDDAVTKLDAVARKYVSPGGTEIVPYRAISEHAGVKPEDLEDSLQAQIRFASELERYFKIAPANSLQGVNEKAADIIMSGVTGNKPGMVSGIFQAATDKIRGVNEENAMKALRRLVSD